MVELTQEDILLSLIQGTSGSAWAEDKKGWKRNDDSDGGTKNENNINKKANKL